MSIGRKGCTLENYTPRTGYGRGSIKSVACWLLLALLLLTTGVCIAETPPQEGRLLVTIDADKRPLKDVLAEIASQIDWTVIVDKNLADTAVTGTYKDIELEAFLKRTFKGENLIVLYDEELKTIDVRAFGENGVKRAIISEESQVVIPDEEALQALRAKEEQIYEEYISNPDSIEPLTGMTLGEIAAIQAAEQKAYDAYITNPNSVEPLTGMTLGEIAALKEEEQKRYDEYLSNPESIEPLTGMSLADIDSLRIAESNSTNESFPQQLQ